jgi:hypothetical protein
MLSSIAPPSGQTISMMPRFICVDALEYGSKPRYDDFLGQIFLKDRSEYLGRNQDAALVDFIEMVQQSPSAKFILTTREHILRSALQVSERLAQSVLLQHRCVLELRDYSYGDKARILYNHLYFSDLPQEIQRCRAPR